MGLLGRLRSFLFRRRRWLPPIEVLPPAFVPEPVPRSRMYPYPEINHVIEAASVVAPILRGGKVETADGAQAGWIVVGFGMSQVLPQKEHDPQVEVLTVVALTNEQAALLLGGLTGNVQAAAIIPWQEIAKLLLPLLLDYAMKRLGQ